MQKNKSWELYGVPHTQQGVQRRVGVYDRKAKEEETLHLEVFLEAEVT
jgi:hypothetical protein